MPALLLDGRPFVWRGCDRGGIGRVGFGLETSGRGK